MPQTLWGTAEGLWVLWPPREASSEMSGLTFLLQQAQEAEQMDGHLFQKKNGRYSINTSQSLQEAILETTVFKVTSILRCVFTNHHPESLRRR